MIYIACRDIGLPVSLGNFSALVCFASYNHDCLVLEVVHVGKRSVTLYKHGSVDLDVQLATQIGHALRLMLAAAVGEKDERYAF